MQFQLVFLPALLHGLFPSREKSDLLLLFIYIILIFIFLALHDFAIKNFQLPSRPKKILGLHGNTPYG
jgi:hypothetical protein